MSNAQDRTELAQLRAELETARANARYQDFAELFKAELVKALPAVREAVRFEIAGMTYETDEKRMREIASELDQGHAEDTHLDEEQVRKWIQDAFYEHRNTISHIGAEYITSQAREVAQFEISLIPQYIQQLDAEDRMRELAEEVYSEHIGFPGPGLIRQIVSEELAKSEVGKHGHAEIMGAVREMVREEVLESLRRIARLS